MKYPTPQKLAEIAQIIDAEYVGPADFEVLGQNEIHVVEPGDIVFVDHPKYYDKALASNATIVLINKKVECPKGKALLISDDPFRDFNILTKKFSPFIASTAQIDKTATIGEGTIIQPGVAIGAKVKIGANCIIHANTVINYNCELGDNVIIHSNVVIGSEAFYYKKRETGYDKLFSGGKVILEDNVEIGAGTTIDRGVSGNTKVSEGTKIDNLCHIAHDTIVGRHCLIAAQVAIAGCSELKDHVTLWGKVGVTSGVTLGEKVVVLAYSGVSKNLEEGKIYSGVPAQEARIHWKEMASVRQLPSIMKELKKE